MKDFTRISKTMSYALRHNPEKFGLILDEYGWADAYILLSSLNKLYTSIHLTFQDMEEIVCTDEKGRYEIKDGKIRAVYGHSVKIKIKKKKTKPPEILYHGTTPKAAESILKSELLPMGRQYVHLSIDKETAIKVGERRTDKPVVLKVMAASAYKDGINFYEENNGIWLSDRVPAKYIGVTK